jgi:glycosyltransferase involved in cell wall biosynthesis
MVNGSMRGGGAEHVIANLSRKLRDNGHRVSVAVLSSGGEVLDVLRAEGFETVPALCQSRSRINVLTSARKRSRLIRRCGVDVVHTHDLRSLLDIGASRRLGGGFRHVHTFHFGNYPHIPRTYLVLERLFAAAPDRLVAVGHAQRSALIAAHGWSPRALEVIPNGIDPPPPASRVVPNPLTPAGVPVIGSISAFSPQKGLNVLLEAAHMLVKQGARFHLLMVGDGPLRSELESMADALGIRDVVHFTGWIPGAASSVLPRLDVFVQSSLWEAMSIAILEAMAAARPIVATSVGDNERVLQQGRAGLVVPANDAGALAAALSRLLQDDALRGALAAAASEAYRREFTARIMASRYETLYKREMATS